MPILGARISAVGPGAGARDGAGVWGSSRSCASRAGASACAPRAKHPLLAAQRGIGLHGIYALAWGLATFTGGMAGMLIACDAGLEGTLVIIG